MDINEILSQVSLEWDAEGGYWDVFRIDTGKRFASVEFGFWDSDGYAYSTPRIFDDDPKQPMCWGKSIEECIIDCWQQVFGKS